jgi:hypothetical protein
MDHQYKSLLLYLKLIVQKMMIILILIEYLMMLGIYMKQIPNGEQMVQHLFDFYLLEGFVVVFS